jgi:hypothetical protein
MFIKKNNSMINKAIQSKRRIQNNYSGFGQLAEYLYVFFGMKRT